MKADALTVTIRPRVPYEAMDLGLSLVQAHTKQLYTAWAVVMIPVSILAATLLVLWPKESWIGSGILWWLKPLYDRILLQVLSHAVFGEAVTARQVLKALPSFFRTGLIGALTWRRIGLARSFRLPVWLLEGLPRRERRQRMAVLGKGSNSHASWLTIACFHLETILVISILSLAIIMVPDELGFSFGDFIQNDRLSTYFSFLVGIAYLCALLIIEPLYVAAGFALYLNRRTELEGWDIELAFRKLAARLEHDGKQAA